MVNLILVNIILQVLWYIIVGGLFLYKYTSLFIQLKNILKFGYTIIKNISWFFTKTWSYIKNDKNRDLERQPLLPKEQDSTFQKPTVFQKIYNKTRIFFGFKPKKHQNTHQGIVLENISSSNLFHHTPESSKHLSNESNKYPTLDSLIQYHQDSDSELLMNSKYIQNTFRSHSDTASETSINSSNEHENNHYHYNHTQLNLSLPFALPSKSKSKSLFESQSESLYYSINLKPANSLI